MALRGGVRVWGVLLLLVLCQIEAFPRGSAPSSSACPPLAYQKVEIRVQNKGITPVLLSTQRMSATEAAAFCNCLSEQQLPIAKDSSFFATGFPKVQAGSAFWIAERTDVWGQRSCVAAANGLATVRPCKNRYMAVCTAIKHSEPHSPSISRASHGSTVTAGSAVPPGHDEPPRASGQRHSSKRHRDAGSSSSSSLPHSTTHSTSTSYSSSSNTVNGKKESRQSFEHAEARDGVGKRSSWTSHQHCELDKKRGVWQCWEEDSQGHEPEDVAHRQRSQHGNHHSKGHVKTKHGHDDSHHDSHHDSTSDHAHEHEQQRLREKERLRERQRKQQQEEDDEREDRRHAHEHTEEHQWQMGDWENREAQQRREWQQEIDNRERAAFLERIERERERYREWQEVGEDF